MSFRESFLESELPTYLRVAIMGGLKTGKTYLAKKLAGEPYSKYKHTQSFRKEVKKFEEGGQSYEFDYYDFEPISQLNVSEFSDQQSFQFLIYLYRNPSQIEDLIKKIHQINQFEERQRTSDNMRQLKKICLVQTTLNSQKTQPKPIQNLKALKKELNLHKQCSIETFFYKVDNESSFEELQKQINDLKFTYRMSQLFSLPLNTESAEVQKNQFNRRENQSSQKIEENLSEQFQEKNKLFTQAEEIKEQEEKQEVKEKVKEEVKEEEQEIKEKIVEKNIQSKSKKELRSEIKQEQTLLSNRNSFQVEKQNNFEKKPLNEKKYEQCSDKVLQEQPQQTYVKQQRQKMVQQNEQKNKEDENPQYQKKNIKNDEGKIQSKISSQNVEVFPQRKQSKPKMLIQSQTKGKRKKQKENQSQKSCCQIM